MKKYIASMLIAVATIAVVTVGAIAVNAQISDGEYPPIVERIAERFGLNESEVESFFDEVREERREKKQIRAEERLSQAVADGLITEEQKQLIIEKKAELKDEKESLRGLEPEERREAMQELRAEFEEWAEDNGIDLSELRPDSDHKSFRRHRGFGNKFNN